MQTLDSDVKNPDAALNVQFYSKLKKNNYESNAKGEDVFYSADYIKVSIPGDILNIPERPVSEEDKRRFATQWNAYKARSGHAASDFVGTPLTKWARLSEQQILELQAMRFSSVEAIAQASDAHIMGIGMIAGQSAFTFRDEARAFLSKQESDKKLSEADIKVKEMEDKIAAEREKLHAEMTAMREQMAAMAQAFQAKAQEEVADVPRRGRPPKQEAA